MVCRHGDQFILSSSTGPAYTCRNNNVNVVTLGAVSYAKVVRGNGKIFHISTIFLFIYDRQAVHRYPVWDVVTS